ncbi:MAG: ABC transporter permease subunit, partial [Bacteroidota bacterium]
GIRLFGNEIPAEQQVQSQGDDGQVETEIIETFGAGNALRNLVIGISQFTAGAAYWIGLLLALFATAPLMVSLQNTGTIDVLLSKPLSRSKLLTGRLVGVFTAVAILITYLMGAVWLVMSLKSGIWYPKFLMSIGVVILMFGVMYGVVTLVSVLSQSTALALIVTYGLIFASIILSVREQLEPQINPPWRSIYVGLYHLLPNFTEVTKTVAQLAGQEPVPGWYPLLSSVLFGLVMYAASYAIFQRKDY